MTTLISDISANDPTILRSYDPHLFKKFYERFNSRCRRLRQDPPFYQSFGLKQVDNFF